jgi:CHASE3 domain sensor protein
MADTKNGLPLNELLARNLDKLTTRITYIVLTGFVLVLLILMIKAWTTFEVVNGQNVGKEWLDLFRDGFLILSGILTTLIGYYFGNRGSEAALKQIEEIKKENEKLLANLDSIAPTIEEEDAGVEAIKIN